MSKPPIASPADLLTRLRSAGLTATLAVERLDGAPLTDKDRETLPVPVEGYEMGRERNPTEEEPACGGEDVEDLRHWLGAMTAADLLSEAHDPETPVDRLRYLWNLWNCSRENNHWVLALLSNPSLPLDLLGRVLRDDENPFLRSAWETRNVPLVLSAEPSPAYEVAARSLLTRLAAAEPPGVGKHHHRVKHARSLATAVAVFARHPAKHLDTQRFAHRLATLFSLPFPDPVTDELLREASDPTTTAERLQEMMELASRAIDGTNPPRGWHLQSNILRNPGLPVDRLRDFLLDRHDDEAWHNPAVPALLTSEPRPEFAEVAARLLVRPPPDGDSAPGAQPLEQLVQAWARVEPRTAWERETRPLARHFAGLFGLPWPASPPEPPSE